MVPLSLMMLCPSWDLWFLRLKVLFISHISHLINPSFSFWNSDEEVVLKYRFYFYSAMVRPTAQEMIVIEKRECYSQFPRGGGTPYNSMLTWAKACLGL